MQTLERLEQLADVLVVERYAVVAHEKLGATVVYGLADLVPCAVASRGEYAQAPG